MRVGQRRAIALGAIGLDGWGNNELEWYTADPANVALEGEGHRVSGNLGGPVFPDTVFPAHMLVDYVRPYRPGSA